MKFQIDASDLKTAVRFVARMSPNKPTQPILSGVLIHADGSTGATFTVFDYERAAQTVADATVDDGGTVLVSARLLQAIADKMPAKTVHVELDGQSVKVKAGTAKFTLPLMPVEEYPQPSFEAEPVAVMTATVFEDAVSRVAPFASNDDVTPIIGAVQVVTDGGVTFRATDRYRVAEAVAEADSATERTLLIPADVLNECAKLFTGRVEILATVSDSPRVVIRGDEGTVSTLTINGNYPPIERLMNVDMDRTSTVDAQELIDAVGRCALVIEREAALRFEFDSLQLTIGGAGNGSGSTETIECDGDEHVLALKPQFVSELAKACRAEKIRIEWAETVEGSKPGPILMHGSRGFRALLQPNILAR